MRGAQNTNNPINHSRPGGQGELHVRGSVSRLSIVGEVR